MVSSLNDEYVVLSLEEGLFADEFSSDAINSYSEDIEFIQPDYEISIFAENEMNTTVPEKDVTLSDEAAEAIPEISVAEDNTGDVIVAVIDTGIDIYHSAYSERIFVNENEATDGEDNDSNGYTDDVYGWDFINNTDQSGISLDSNHGTHVTGLIAGSEIGEGTNAKILPLKVFENGTAYTSDIINAIEYAENMGAKIVNCSWGTTTENPALEQAIEGSDMLFVCAAGNSAANSDEMPVYPASYELDNVISVGAINDRDYLAYFSNYGSNVDLTANGYNVYSTFVNNGYGVMNGTSMSAAYVTGAAAGIYSESAAATKNRLLSSCDMVSTLTDKIDQGRRINYYNAVNGIIVTEMYENTNIDYPTEHKNEVKDSLDGFELYDLDPEPIAVCAGNDHSLILNSFGDVRTYGDNTYKQLGKQYDGSVYFMKDTVQGLGIIKKVSSFENFNLALDSDGYVYAWGQNNRYQLGTTEDNEFMEIPTKVEFFNSDGTTPTIVDIEAGGWFSLALDSDGNMWAWGDNKYGQMAVGYEGYRFSAPRIIMSGVSAMSAGKYHALAVKNGIAYGWGRNAEEHPLGEDAAWAQTTPIQITDLPGNVLDVEAGDRCSFFITTEGVYAMGLNDCGQLGDGTTETRSVPTKINVSAETIESNGSTLFKSGGTVYACGANTYGQLGQGYENTRIETPAKIQELLHAR